MADLTEYTRRKFCLSEVKNIAKTVADRACADMEKTIGELRARIEQLEARLAPKTRPEPAKGCVVPIIRAPKNKNGILFVPPTVDLYRAREQIDRIVGMNNIYGDPAPWIRARIYLQLHAAAFGRTKPANDVFRPAKFAWLAEKISYICESTASVLETPRPLAKYDLQRMRTFVNDVVKSMDKSTNRTPLRQRDIKLFEECASILVTDNDEKKVIPPAAPTTRMRYPGRLPEPAAPRLPLTGITSLKRPNCGDGIDYRKVAAKMLKRKRSEEEDPLWKNDRPSGPRRSVRLSSRVKREWIESDESGEERDDERKREGRGAKRERRPSPVLMLEKRVGVEVFRCVLPPKARAPVPQQPQSQPPTLTAIGKIEVATNEAVVKTSSSDENRQNQGVEELNKMAGADGSASGPPVESQNRNGEDTPADKPSLVAKAEKQVKVEDDPELKDAEQKKAESPDVEEPKRAEVVAKAQTLKQTLRPRRGLVDYAESNDGDESEDSECDEGDDERQRPKLQSAVGPSENERSNLDLS